MSWEACFITKNTAKLKIRLSWIKWFRAKSVKKIPLFSWKSNQKPLIPQTDHFFPLHCVELVLFRKKFHRYKIKEIAKEKQFKLKPIDQEFSEYEAENVAS